MLSGKRNDFTYYRVIRDFPEEHSTTLRKVLFLEPEIPFQSLINCKTYLQKQKARA